MAQLVFRLALLATAALSGLAVDGPGAGKHPRSPDTDHRVIVRFATEGDKQQQQQQQQQQHHRDAFETDVARLETKSGVVRVKALKKLGMAIVTLDSDDALERFLDEIDGDDSVDVAVPDTWVYADDFEAPVSDFRAHQMSAAPVRSLEELVEHRRMCSANPACKARGLTGSCCPEPDGTMLSCCSMHFEHASVALGTFHSTYIATTAGGTVSARAAAIGVESKFEMVVHSDESVSFRTAFGTYLSAAESGWITAVAQEIGERERFKVIFNRNRGTFSLGTSTGEFVSVEPTGHVMANRPKADLWEAFVITKIQGVHQRFPDDPDFQQLWGMNSFAENDIDAPEAWKMWTGAEGQSIVVGVIDTGIDYTHEDLREQMWVNPNEIPGNGIDDDGNGYVDDVHGADFANDDGDPMDDQLHGTHCSGTIAGVGNNGVGVAGVAWRGARLMALKFLGSDGSGRASDAISAVEYAIAHGAKILSNSWGGGGSSPAMRMAIQRAEAAGILFVAAAGNSGTDNDIEPHYPANYEVDNIISVASTTPTGELSSFSCYGNLTVHVAAPGSGIYSTAPDNKYQLLSGTSMATPHVSGVAALLWMYRPQLSMQEVRQTLVDSVEKSSKLEGRLTSGGLVNAKNALETAWAFEPPQPPVHPPQGLVFVDKDPVVGTYSGVVTIMASTNESDIGYYRVYFVSAAGFPLEPLGGKVPATGEAELALTLEGSLALPKYASGLVAVSGRSKGEMTTKTPGVPTLTLEDYGVPEVNARGATWLGDSDLRSGWVAGTFEIERARAERSISHYNIYWRGETGERGDLAGVVPATGFSEPSCDGGACALITNHTQGKAYVFERQPYGDNEQATISLSGPGNITLVRLKTEHYWDTLTIGGSKELSGDMSEELPMEFALPEGPGKVTWVSDKTVNASGWAFMLEQFGAVAKFHLNATQPAASGLEVVAAFGPNEFPGEGLRVTVVDYDLDMWPSSAFAPVSIDFMDMDPAAGEVSGVAKIEPAPGAAAAGVSSYHVDFADGTGKPLGEGWSIESGGSDKVELGLSATAVPAGATQLIARAQSKLGYSERFAATPLIDIVPVKPSNATWSGDKDGRPGRISGDLTISPAVPEVGVVEYVAYWAEGGKKTVEAARQKPRGFGVDVVCHFPRNTEAQGSAILVVSAYAWGEMAEGRLVDIDDLNETRNETRRRLDEAPAADRVPPTFRKAPRQPALMTGAEPWLRHAAAATAGGAVVGEVRWVAEAVPDSMQKRSSLHASVTIAGVAARAAAVAPARGALIEAIADELKAEAWQVQLLRISDPDAGAAAAEEEHGGRRRDAARIDFAIEPAVARPEEKRSEGASSLDRLEASCMPTDLTPQTVANEARLIRLSHSGSAVARFDRSLAGALKEAGVPLPAGAPYLPHARVGEPKMLGPRAAAAATALVLASATASNAPGRKLSTGVLDVASVETASSEEQAGAAYAAAACIALALVTAVAIAPAAYASVRRVSEKLLTTRQKATNSQKLLHSVQVDSSAAEVRK